MKQVLSLERSAAFNTKKKYIDNNNRQIKQVLSLERSAAFPVGLSGTQFPFLCYQMVDTCPNIYFFLSSAFPVRLSGTQKKR
jgi:hypothetical protein